MTSTYSRRTLVKGAAWSVPAVALTVPAPAMAASGCIAGTVKYPQPGEYTVQTQGAWESLPVSEWSLVDGDPTRVQYILTGNNANMDRDIYAQEYSYYQMLTVPPCTKASITYSVSMRRTQADSNITQGSVLIRYGTGAPFYFEFSSQAGGTGVYIPPSSTLGEWGEPATRTWEYTNSGTTDFVATLLQISVGAQGKTGDFVMNDDVRIIATVVSSPA